MSEILSRLPHEIFVYDGAMGTLLQEKGILKPGMCPESLNVSHPAEIEAIHRLYLDAGADIIETNTFGGHRLKLSHFGYESEWKQLNHAAVANARKAIRASGKKAYIAAGIGPYEKMVAPLGPITFDEAVAMYREWAEVVTAAGADIILFETFSDIKELKAAIMGAREVSSLPIQAQLTFGEDGRTVTGTPPDAAAVILAALDVQIIGMNCSAGPKELLPLAKTMVQYTKQHIVVQPNAGLPQLVGDKTVFRETPEGMAAFGRLFVEAGVGVLGGCCGTTPAHIAAIKKAVASLKPSPRQEPVRFALASRTKIFTYHEHERPFVIGERINPTGKKEFSQELREGKTTYARRLALEQTKNGAHVLDVNVGAAGVDEPVMMRAVVGAVETVSDLPLVIDSVNPQIIEEGLKASCGKVLINSVNGEEKSLAVIIPLARKYGAALLGLTTDEEGLAKTVEKRVEIAERIMKRAIDAGIQKNDLVIDALTLTISVEKEQAGYTLGAITHITKDLGLLTSLGVSNVSFGLPHRDIINASFLSLAVGAGLDMAILNPNNEAIMQTVRLKVKKDPTPEAINAFIAESFELQYKDIPKPVREKAPVSSDTIEKALRDAILYGEKENILELVDIALTKGLKPLDINLNILIPAIEEVGKKFESREYFLPQIIMAAEAMQKACGRLNEVIKGDESLSKGTVVMATVEGDIHDIGKNIVIAVLESYGYKVLDLGRDVKNDLVVREVLTHKATVVGLSALMTTTMIQMENVIKELVKQNPSIKVMVGGAAVTRDFADKIGAAGYAKDAIEAVRVVEKLVNANVSP